MFLFFYVYNYMLFSEQFCNSYGNLFPVAFSLVIASCNVQVQISNFTFTKRVCRERKKISNEMLWKPIEPRRSFRTTGERNFNDWGPKTSLIFGLTFLRNIPRLFTINLFGVNPFVFCSVFSPSPSHSPIILRLNLFCPSFIKLGGNLQQIQSKLNSLISLRCNILWYSQLRVSLCLPKP